MALIDPALFIRDLFQGINAQDPDRVLPFYAADCESLDVSRALLKKGHAGLREALNEWWGAFPDLWFTPQTLVVQAGQLACYWTAEGTHQGVFMSMPPSGRRLEVCGVSLLTVCAGRIIRDVHLWDMAGLLRSMKLLPDLPGRHAVGQATMLAHFLQASPPPLPPGRGRKTAAPDGSLSIT